MKKKKCPVCNKRKAKRMCETRSREMICPVCCAESRNSSCEACTYFHTAEKYRSRGRRKKAKTEEFVVEINPEVEVEVDEALELIEKRRVKEAGAILSDLLKSHPDNHMVHYGIGVIYMCKRKYDKAIEHFDRATDIFPLLLEAHYNKGAAYKQKEDPVNMIRSFQQVALLGNPKDDTVRRVAPILNDFEKEVIEMHGADLNTYLEGSQVFDEAFSLMQNKEYEKALDGFKSCLSMIENHTQSYGNMGMCLAMLGQKEKAVEALDKALEIDPDYLPAKMNRKALLSHKDGQPIRDATTKRTRRVDFYKDGRIPKKSLLARLLGFFSRGS